MHRSALRTLALLLLETVLIMATVALATWLRIDVLRTSDGPSAWDVWMFENGVWKALIVTGVTQGCLYFADLYNLKFTADRRDLFIHIIQALAAASFILAAAYFWFPDLMIGRGVFAIAAILVIVVVVGWRLAYEFVSRAIGPRERLLLVGTNSAASHLPVSCTIGASSLVSRSSASWIRIHSASASP
jgi:FlaA1/EpsC-like NDP-sugar epimerase